MINRDTRCNMNTEKTFKHAVENGCTTIEAPLKFTIGASELENLAKFANNEDIVLTIQDTGMGAVIKASKEWDGELIDFTDYGNF